MMMPHILVVDQDRATAECCRQYLVARDLADVIDIVTTADGEDALLILKTETFSLIVGDVRIAPKSLVSGLDLLQAVRGHRTVVAPETPFVMVANAEDSTKVADAILHNVSAFLIKPLDPCSFATTIASLLAVNALTSVTREAALARRKAKIIDSLANLDTALPRALEDTWALLGIDVDQLPHPQHGVRLRRKQELRRQLSELNQEIGAPAVVA